MFKLLLIIIFIALVVYITIYLYQSTEIIGGKSKKYYYHGSPYKITGDLIPKPSKVINNEEAVFATNQRWLALVFLSEHTNKDLSFGFLNGEPIIEEMYPGAMKILKASGYIYYVDPTDFTSDSRLGMRGHEFIQKKPVKILKTEYISDAWKELQNLPIKFVYYKSKSRISIH